MRVRLCKYCRGWHDLDEPWPHNCRDEPNWNHADFATPLLIRDEMPPTQSMVDGKIYTSKSALRATYMPDGNKDGIRYVELGNEPQRFERKAKPKVSRKEIRDTIRKAQARRARGERV